MGSRMSRSGRILGLVVVTAAAVVVVGFAVSRVRESQNEADLVVDGFEAQLAGLSPVTRAAVLARLSSDGLKKLRRHQSE